MQTTLRSAGARLILLAACLCCPWLAHAQTWPAKVIRLVVPFPPGGPADIIARQVVDPLGTALGQSIVVDNRVGASGTIGAAAVANAPPDGYTLLMGTSNELTMSPTLYKALPYDPNKSFAAVTVMGEFPNVLVVRPGLPVNSFAEFVALARRQKLSIATSGVGSTNHLTTEIFKGLAKVDYNHIPYKGGSQAVADVIGNQVDALFATGPSVVALIKSGKMRALMVTAANRSPALPEVPTAREVGMPGLIVTTWNGVLAPAGTPRAIVEQLNRELVKIAATAEFREKMLSAGFEATSSTSDAFTATIKRDTAHWAEVIKSAGISPE